MGRWLAVGIPPVGASLLGSGVLGCLGLVHLAESVGPGRAGLDADCELLVRSLLAATGTALMASNPVRALAVSLGGLLAGLGAAAIGSRTRPFWRGMRLLAGLLLLGLCFFTFRGAT
ncbi:MAG: hypothetical protein QME79_02735 [Bacillota bacterium]|nr:hypothetical protein [Bacillota bacterium]